jgi:xanthine dehydrogenase YagS FAD-binding subunit
MEDPVQPFEYQRASDPQAAVSAIGSASNAKFLAGGTNLVDLMKQQVELPTHLIDINRLDLAKIEELPDGGLRLGALARNSDTADHPLVRQRYPMLAQAILAGASPQLRNMATNGGNLLQRTRCYYFYDPAYEHCNKRKPGSGCAAIHGYNRIHAILGASPDCIATHPSDMCVALAALGAVVQVRGTRGSRTIQFADFHRLPGNQPEVDTNLRPDELILSIDLPKGPYAAHSAYIKVRDRASYAFALVSAAAALDLDGGTIRSSRLALGGVAHKPWRSEKAETALAGKQANDEAYGAAADEILAGAKPYEHNAFKLALAKKTIVRAFTVAAANGENA